MHHRIRQAIEKQGAEPMKDNDNMERRTERACKQGARILYMRHADACGTSPDRCSPRLGRKGLPNSIVNSSANGTDSEHPRIKGQTVIAQTDASDHRTGSKRPSSRENVHHAAWRRVESYPSRLQDSKQHSQANAVSTRLCVQACFVARQKT